MTNSVPDGFVRPVDGRSGRPPQRARRAPRPTLFHSLGNWLAWAVVCAFAGAAEPASAQRLFGCEQGGVLIEFDPFDGAVKDLAALDLKVLVGAPVGPVEAVSGPRGELWVSDLASDRVLRFDGADFAYLGELPTSFVNPRGMAPFGKGMVVVNSGFIHGPSQPSLVHVDDAGQTLAVHLVSSPTDVVPYTHNGTNGLVYSVSWPPTIMFADANDLSNQSVFWSLAGVSTGHFFDMISGRQNGNLLAAAFTQPPAIYEFDPSGTLVRFTDLSFQPSITALRAVHELGNGNLLLGGLDGVFLLDESTQTVTQLLSDVILRSFGEVRTDIGAPYCTALPNSLGVPGSMSAFGKRLTARNDVVLTASDLPPLQFGIFITSRIQALQVLPNGGSLCLGGQIGRFQNLEQIFQADGGGRGSLRVDLTAIPQTTWTVAVQPGETWNFQAWYRDPASPSTISNFTEGLEITFQ
ncbi:MAG: hypothetical protein AAFZ87_00855 [Planctomycetota bacterium]